MASDGATFEISGEQIVFRLRRREQYRRAYFVDDNWLSAVRSITGEAKFQSLIRATLDAAGDHDAEVGVSQDVVPTLEAVPAKDDGADMTAAVLGLIRGARNGISNKELLSELMAMPAFNVKLSKNTNYLYTVLGRLEHRGEIRREGRKNFSVRATPDGETLPLGIVEKEPRVANGSAAHGDV